MKSLQSRGYIRTTFNWCVRVCVCVGGCPPYPMYMVCVAHAHHDRGAVEKRRTGRDTRVRLLTIVVLRTSFPHAGTPFHAPTGNGITGT
jgi:hypothetical protein